MIFYECTSIFASEFCWMMWHKRIRQNAWHSRSELQVSELVRLQLVLNQNTKTVQWRSLLGHYFLSSLTLCEATARSTKLRKKQSYQSVFYQKKEAFLLITTLPCLKVFVSLITKNKSKSSWAHWKVCQKSSQREVIRKNAYKAPKPQRVLLPALLLKFSRSLTNFQASPGRQSSLRSKDRYPNHAVVWIAAGIEHWQTVHFQLCKPDTRTRTAYNSTAGREDGGKRNFRGPKRQLFLQNEGFFKASTWSLVIQLHAREKWRRWVTITTKK